MQELKTLRGDTKKPKLQETAFYLLMKFIALIKASKMRCYTQLKRVSSHHWRYNRKSILRGEESALLSRCQVYVLKALIKRRLFFIRKKQFRKKDQIPQKEYRTKGNRRLINFLAVMPENY